MESECKDSEKPIIQFSDKDGTLHCSCSKFGRPSVRFMRDTTLDKDDPRFWVCIDFDCRCTHLEPNDMHELLDIVYDDFHKWFLNNRSSEQLEFDF